MFGLLWIGPVGWAGWEVTGEGGRRLIKNELLPIFFPIAVYIVFTLSPRNTTLSERKMKNSHRIFPFYSIFTWVWIKHSTLQLGFGSLMNTL